VLPLRGVETGLRCVPVRTPLSLEASVSADEREDTVDLELWPEESRRMSLPLIDVPLLLRLPLLTSDEAPVVLRALVTKLAP
jgi:hypothetical protein